MSNEASLFSGIGIATIAATTLAYLGHLLRQPLLLAYIATGVMIGPKLGFGWIQSEEEIKAISEIGLVLLLFMIGLELDLKKIREAGKSLVLTGILQFLLCAVIGVVFFGLIGFTFSGNSSPLGFAIAGGKYDLFYLSAALALSSTAIVVKLLYEKFELDTLAGRITLGVLVFQDLWAIVLLGVQPNLANPQMGEILFSFAKGGALVAVSLLLSRYVLKFLFHSIAKVPELVLVASLGWCFLVARLADFLGLSVEMGALIAGAAISTFPYNLDVIAKIVSIRDFFITLFFVSLGMLIPNPLQNPGLLLLSLAAALFLIASRFLTVFPLLYFLKNGNRVSLLTSINLAQLSEFALVIATLGLSLKHIGQDTFSIILFVFVTTSVISTYLIKYSHGLQNTLSRFAAKIGFRDLAHAPKDDLPEAPREIALLGFFQIASALLREIEERAPELKEKIVVVDFNPHAHHELKKKNIRAVYGDISHLDTLHHAKIAHAKIILSTIPDTLLRGTGNLRLIKQIRRIAPHAKIIVTAESAERALKMYQEGADFVLVPRIINAEYLLPVVERILRGEEKAVREEETAKLSERVTEVLA
jgi:Kef-type K+ transport system membrane component KefB